MTTFLDVMNLWASPQDLASDLGAKVSRVQKWRARRRIPPKAWPEVLAAARRRGLSVDADMLLSIGTRKARVRREAVLSQ